MRQLCFATGNLYRLIGKKDIVDLISRLDIDGVEYTYGRNISERLITEKDVSFLRSLDYVSIHSPFSLSLKKISPLEVQKCYEIISSNAKRIGAKNVVFHPGQVLPEKFFSNKNFNFLTENMHKKPLRNKIDFERVLNSNSNAMLCLDAMHAYTWSSEECTLIVNKWKKRIAQVHFSNCYRKNKHVSFEKVSSAFLKSIEPIFDLNVPIIIEEDMPYTKLSEIKAEVKRVKNILGF